MSRQTKQSSPTLGASLVVLSSFFYASYGIWTKLLGGGFDGYSVAALRSVIVVLILLPLAIKFRQFERLNLSKNWKYLAGIFVASLLVWGPLYFAILHAGIGPSIAVNFASILTGTFFFGWLLVGEKMTKGKIISALLGLVGIGMVFLPNQHSGVNLALFAAAISGIASSSIYVVAKRIEYNSTQTTLLMWTLGAAANFLMAYLLHASYPSLHARTDWLYIACFSIASVAASWCLVRGIKLIDAGIAGILGLMEIVFALVFGIVFFGEHPANLAIAGTCVIIIAATVPYVRSIKLMGHTDSL